MSRSAFHAVLPVFLPLAVAACGSSDSGDDASGAQTGGPFRPQGNGQAIGESAACARFELAVANKRKDLSCGTTTGVVCPDLLRLTTSETKCASWDEGTIKGCEDFFAKQTSCDKLGTEACVPSPIAGSGTGEEPCTKLSVVRREARAAEA